jgi:hypothetical protein
MLDVFLLALMMIIFVYFREAGFITTGVGGAQLHHPGPIVRHVLHNVMLAWDLKGLFTPWTMESSQGLLKFVIGC